MHQIIMQALSAAVVATICCQCHAFESELVQTARVDSQPCLAEFNVATEGDVLLIPVVIDGRRHLFLVDTGSATNALDSALTQSLAPLRQSSRRYPSGFLKMYEFPDARLDGTSIRITDDAAIVDLSELRRMSGYNIQGMLGIPFLRRFVIDINFDTGKLKLLPLDTHPKPNPIRITRDPHHRPILVIDLVKNEITPFLVDTGMALPGVGELKARTFDEMLQSDRLKVFNNQAKVVTASGVIASQKAELDVFRIGEYEHRNLRVTAGGVNAIGLRLLSRYQVRFDFTQERGWFEPGERFHAKPMFDASGLMLAREGLKTVVHEVAPDSPAQSVGFRKGDVITHINQSSLRDESLFRIRKALCRNGTTLDINRIREGQEDVVHLVLSDWQRPRPTPTTSSH